MIDDVVQKSAEVAKDKGLIESALDLANSVWLLASGNAVALSVVYAVGALLTLIALLYKNWRYDAEEASWSVPNGDKFKIYEVAYKLSRERRWKRSRRLITHTLLWPLVLSCKLVAKLVSFTFFVPMFIADRGKDKAFKDGLKRAMSSNGKGTKPSSKASGRVAARLRGHQPPKMTCGKCLAEVSVTDRHFCGPSPGDIEFEDDEDPDEMT